MCNSTCKNKLKRKDKIVPRDASFLRKSSLKIYQVYLDLANSRRDRKE